MMKGQVDQVILNELMNAPEVRKETEGMTRREQRYFKQLLVSTGIYERYVEERKKNNES